MERKNDIEKSIDSCIDELFGTAESLEKAQPEKVAIAEKKPAKGKSIGDSQKSDDTADENGAKAEGETEEDGKNGRPKDPSNMGHRDASGASHLNYDASITSPAVKPPGEMGTIPKIKKGVEISEEDFEILQKAKADKKAEELRKSKQEQEDLIKSAVDSATKSLRDENAELKKSFQETQELVKSLRMKPRAQKSISSVQALEKSMAGHTSDTPRPEGEAFSKSDVLDAAERLMKAGKLKMEHVIELEDTGNIYDRGAKSLIEAELQKQPR